MVMIAKFLVVDLACATLSPEHGPHDQAQAKRDGTGEETVAIPPVGKDALCDFGSDKVVDDEGKGEKSAVRSGFQSISCKYRHGRTDWKETDLERPRHRKVVTSAITI